MNSNAKNRERDGFDAIVVGSGPGGATVARELSRRGSKVLILERGGYAPPRESFFGTASVLSNVNVGEALQVTRAIAVGGTTSVYFGVADAPPLEPFLARGVDLSMALQDARADLPLTVLPDELMGAQALRLRDAAGSAGCAWGKRQMLLDTGKLASGDRFGARWTAGDYVRDAVSSGAELVTRATATRVLIGQGRAVGIEYEVRSTTDKIEVRQAFAAKTILAAGAGATPMLLKASGIADVAGSGFCCHPTLAVFGIVPGLKATDNFAGSMGFDFGEGLSIGDANFSPTFYRMFMFANRRWIRCFRYSASVAIGVMMREGLGGSLGEDGYRKRIEPEDLHRLETGKTKALEIMRKLGARHVHCTDISAGHLGGMIAIGRDVDTDLQAAVRDLHVCDNSIIPHDVKVSPTLTLVCLGKYLADRLSPS